MELCSEDGNLYSKEYSHDNLITKNAKVINQVCFYGRAIGFQYCDSMKPILRFLAVNMASFSESYYSTGFNLMNNQLFTTSKYFLDPEHCAQRIVNISHNADLEFCKVWKRVLTLKLALKFIFRLTGSLPKESSCTLCPASSATKLKSTKFLKSHQNLCRFSVKSSTNWLTFRFQRVTSA